MFGVFFVAAGFGAAINGVQRTNWGHLFNISYLIGSVWVNLFEGANQTTNGARLLPRAARRGAAAVVLAGPRWSVLCLICLYMLARKIRGTEVVR